MSEPAPAPTDPRDLADFSDRLSPMLVKELRQGMRTNLFTISFILLQGFMVICILTGAADPQGSTETVSGFFWFFLMATLIFIMPIRGFSALSSEIKLDTIDLLSLTRLDALRITFGKWSALVAQTLLFVASVLPYVVLRYFFGGINILQEMLMIAGATLLSCVLTAVTVGFSAFPSILIRLFVIGGILFFFFVGGVSFTYGRAMGMSGSVGTVGPEIWGYVVMVVTALYLIYFLLEMGASRIAPESANHSTRKRLAMLGFVILLILLTVVGDADGEMIFVIAGMAGTLALIDAMTEPPTLVPSVYRPFASNPFKRLLAKILAPGWHTAIVFFLLVVGAVFAMLLFNTTGSVSLSDEDDLLAMLSLAAALVFPLPIIHLFVPRVTSTRGFFGVYLLVQVCLTAVAIFVVAVADSASGIASLLYVCMPIPHVTFAIASNNDADTYFIVAASAFLLLSLIIWYSRARPLLKQSNEIMRLIREGQPDEEIPSERFLQE